MIACLMLGLLVAAGLAAIRGWTADSRDVAQSLWSLERVRPNAAMPTPGLRDRRLHRARLHDALRPTARGSL